jgi:hypothetical protein
MQHTLKMASKDSVFILKKMNEVNKWKEQYNIVGAPYDWGRFVNFHGREIDDHGEIIELEAEALANKGQTEPTEEEYSNMSDIKQRLTRQTFLIRKDVSKIRSHRFYVWDDEKQATVPESEAQSKQRGRAWVWVTQCFINFPYVWRSCIPQDIFSVFAKLCQISKPPPPVVRQKISLYNNTYILPQETYLHFAERLNFTAEELRGLGEEVSKDALLNALLGGVQYHAKWFSGYNPQPALTKSRFYAEVDKIDMHNALTKTPLSREEVDARLERIDKLVSVTAPETAKTEYAANYTTGEPSKPCFKFQDGNCKNGSKCRYSHTFSSEGRDNRSTSKRQQVPLKLKKLCNEEGICMDYQLDKCKRDKCKYTHKKVKMDSSGKCRKCHKSTHEGACKFKVSANNTAKQEEDDDDNYSESDEIIGHFTIIEDSMPDEKVFALMVVVTHFDTQEKNQETPNISGLMAIKDGGTDVQILPCIDSGAGGHIFDVIPDNCYLVPGTRREARCTIITSKAGATLPADSKADLVLQSNVSMKSTTGLLLRNTIMGVKGLVRPLISVSCLSLDGVTAIFRSNVCLFLDNTRQLIVIAVRTDNLYLVPKDRQALNQILGEPNVDDIYSEFNDATPRYPEVAVFSMNTVFIPSNYTNALELIHHRYGCLNYRTVRKHWGESLPHSKGAKVPFCKTCGATQIKKSPFPQLPPPNLKPGDRTDHDWIPGPSRSYRGNTGGEFLIDRVSAYPTIKLCKSKSESQTATINHKRVVETKFERSLKILKGDSSRENTGNLTADECKKTGTIQNWSNPYDKEQSGFHERHIGIWKAVKRAIVNFSGVPDGLWDYAWEYAVDIRRYSPKVLKNGENTNSSLIYNNGEVSPFSSMLRVFGCEAYGLIPKENRNDTNTRAFRGVFLGFQPGVKAYRLLNLSTRKVVTCVHVRWNENCLPFKETNKVNSICLDDYNQNAMNENENDNYDSHIVNSDTTVPTGANWYPIQTVFVEADDPDEVQITDYNPGHVKEEQKTKLEPGAQTQDAVDTEGIPQLEVFDVPIPDTDESSDPTRYPKRSRELSKQAIENLAAQNAECRIKEVNFRPNSQLVHAHHLKITNLELLRIKVPTSYKQAMQSDHHKYWYEAMQTEINSHKTMGTWILVEKPASVVKILNSLWVFALKYNDPTNEVTFKARLVAQGSTRTLGIDHTEEEVFSSVLKLKTLRMVIATAVQHKMAKIEHWDIKTAFLAGKLDKVIYMHQPVGFKKCNKICKLVRSIYGLPEAMRIFTDLLAKVLSEAGFKQSPSDASNFRMADKTGWVTIPVFVDDLYPTFTSQALRDNLWKVVSAKFTIRNLGDLKYSLGISFLIDCKAGVATMSQEGQKQRLLEYAGFTDCNPKSTPIVTGTVLVQATTEITMDERQEVSKFPYRSIVAKVNYIALATSPDLSYVVSVLSRFVNDPRREHVTACRRLLQYIKHSVASVLVYRRQISTPFSKLVGFADASHASQEKCRSQVGLLSFLYGNLVFWKSNKTSTVTTSTLHSETVAAHKICMELMWERKLLADLDQAEDGPSLVWQDCAAVISNSYNPTKHEASKHFNVKLFYKRELIEKGQIAIEKLSTDLMLADALTKSFTSSKFKSLMDCILGKVDCASRHGLSE